MSRLAMSSGLMPVFSRARHATRKATRCCGSIATASRGEMPKNSGSNIVAALRNPPRSWISLKPLRREPANSSRTAHPRSTGNGVNASRPWANSSQYRLAVSIPPGASSAMPTTTTGSAAAANLSSATGVYPRGNLVDVVVEVEVAAVVPVQLESAGGMAFPPLQFGGIDARIAVRPQRGDIGRDLHVLVAGVAVDRRIVGTHCGDQQFGEFRVGEQFGIGSTELGHVDEQIVVAGRQVGLRLHGTRGRSRRRPQPLDGGTAGFRDAGEFERDDSTHAVTEKPQRRHLTPGTGDEQTARETLHAFGGGLVEPLGALRILNDVRITAAGGQRCRQLAVSRCGAAGMRKHHRDTPRPRAAARNSLDPGREFLLLHRREVVENHCAASFPASAADTWPASIPTTST